MSVGPEAPVTSHENDASIQGNAAYWLVVILLSVVVGITSFAAAEYHPCYSGSAIQAIEKGSFARDEFMDPAAPRHAELVVPSDHSGRGTSVVG